MVSFVQSKRRYTAVLILGMHRSGTSCLTGSLQQKGLFLGEVFVKNPFNLKGNRENKDIMKLNDSILSFNNSSWDAPPRNIKWNNEHIKERDKIINRFIERGMPVFGFKDPRTIFTLPFWIEGLKNVFLIASFRNPVKVAASLNNRDGMSIPDGLRLWEKYNRELLELYKQQPFPLVNFDVNQKEYELRIISVAKKLLLNKPLNNNTPFYDKTLISNTETEMLNTIPDSIIDLYNTMLTTYNKQRKND